VLVAARLQTTQVAGARVVTRLHDRSSSVGDSDAAHIEGSITSFTSTTQFSVNGIPVDASQAQFPGGTAAVVLGAEVDVKGTSSNGVVIATSVTVETHEAIRADGFELHGAVTALDTVAQTFVLRGVTVSYASATIEWKNGSAALLAVGVQLEVKGTLSADGTMVQATLIAFGD
jgi:hypothetical protein